MPDMARYSPTIAAQAPACVAMSGRTAQKQRAAAPAVTNTRPAADAGL